MLDSKSDSNKKEYEEMNVRDEENSNSEDDNSYNVDDGKNAGTVKFLNHMSYIQGANWIQEENPDDNWNEYQMREGNTTNTQGF